MKTDALISLCGRLLLALMLAAPAGVALSPSPAMAQAAPAAASDKDKAAQGGNANAAAANPAPAPASPIPPANVVSRAESEENALNIIRNRLQASPQRDGIKQRLARLARDTAEARTLSHLAMDSDSQRRMRDIEPTWAQLQAEVTAVDKQLTQVAEALQEDFNRMIQDAHYLVGFGRALAVAAARADDSDTVVQLAAAAQEAVEGERELHNGFMKQHGVTPEQFAATPLSPTAEHYTSYLLATAWGEPWPVAMAALLPCFWIYAEVGRDIHARSKPGNPWQAWVDTYAAEEFHEAVARMRDTLDRIAAATTPAMRERMHAAYTQAARLEWMFWDAAYRLEAWPI